MAVGGLALRVKIVERKQEAQNPFFRVVALDDTTTDPALWGKNFPLQYDLYRRTVDHVRTRASAAARRCRVRPPRPVPARSFRDPQPGTCLHCRRSVYVTYKTVGAGDLIRGFEKVNAMSYPEARKLVEHAVACIDCHDPRTMALRITRPGFLEGIRTLKAAEGITDYDPNRMASRQEMRAFVWALNLARNQHFYAFSHVLPLRVYRQHAPAMVACGTPVAEAGPHLNAGVVSDIVKGARLRYLARPASAPGTTRTPSMTTVLRTAFSSRCGARGQGVAGTRPSTRTGAHGSLGVGCPAREVDPGLGQGYSIFGRPQKGSRGRRGP